MLPRSTSSREGVIEKSKDQYYFAVRQMQSNIGTDTPDWQPWPTYFAQSPAAQKARLEKKTKGKRLILGDRPELSAQILELCREHGRVTIENAARVTSATRNMIKDQPKALTRAGHLERHGAGRAARLRACVVKDRDGCGACAHDCDERGSISR
jgi:hypothetical protein